MHHAIIEAIASHMKPKVYVELGIAVCGTLNRVAPHAEEIYAVDAGVSCAINIQDKDRVRFYGEYTTTFAERWNKEIRKGIDLIFIDADHSAASVQKDVENFLPWLNPSTGLMLLHDTWPPTPEHANPSNCGDCYLIKPWLRNLNFNLLGGHDFEVCTIPTQYGLTLIRSIGKDWREGFTK